jgi:hypothetical protein
VNRRATTTFLVSTGSLFLTFAPHDLAWQVRHAWRNPVAASPLDHCFTLFHISGFLFVSVHVYGIDPPKHVLLSGLGFHVIDRMEFLMWNRNVEIDRTHIRAICNEIGERLRISLSGETPELSLQMRRQLDQLRELDEDASPSIVPAIGRF